MKPIQGTPGNYVSNGLGPKFATEKAAHAEYKGREVIRAVSALERLLPAFCRGGSRDMALSHGDAKTLPCCFFLALATICLLLGAPAEAMAQCTNELSPSNRQHGHGATGDDLSVTVNPLTCSWTVQNTNAWIEITNVYSSGLGFDMQAPFDGTGTGYVNYAVAANPSIVGRTGVVMIANQTFTIRQLGIPCSFSVSPATRIHGSGAATNDFDVLASNQQCPWTATSTNEWIRIVGPTSGLGDYIAVNDQPGVQYEVAFYSQPVWRTGYIHVANAVLTIAQRPSSVCDNLSLDDTNKSHGYAATTNQVLVSASPTCQWVVEKTNDWIIIVFGASGTGTETIRYRLTENPSSFPRTGTIKVMDEVLVIDQGGAPCRYSLPLTSRLHSFYAEDSQFGISAPIGCAWSIRNTNTWIDVLTDTNGSGPATVMYSINANPNLSERTGHLILMANGTNVTTFRVRQERAICTYRVSPATRTHGHAGVTLSAGFSLGLTTSSNGCNWTINNTNDWVTTVRTNTSGGGNIAYAVAPNPYPVQRVAVLYIGNTNLGAPDTFVLTQRAFPCEYELSPKSTMRGFGGGLGTNKVITTSTCPWTASTTNDWITISPAEGVGSNNIVYALARNPAAIQRVGAIKIIGAETNLSFIITQNAADCTYSISPSGRTHGHGAVTADIGVTPVVGCPWTVINTNPWVSVQSGVTNVTYTLQPNATGSPRSGVIRIVPQGGNPVPPPMDFTVAQLAVSCTYTLDPTQLSHGSGVETGSVSVGTSPVCQWDVVNTNGWITIVLGAAGTGPGTVVYSVASNLNLTPRFGTLTIDGQPVTVSQAGYSCAFKLTPDDRTNGQGNVTGVVSNLTGANCTWTVVNTNGWVTITAVSSSAGTVTTPPFVGTGNGSFTYSIPANPYPDPRRGTITVTNDGVSAAFVLTQRGSPCDVRVSPVSRSHGRGATNRSVDVIADDNCLWNVFNTNSWVTIANVTGTTIPGVGTFDYAIEANPNPIARTAHIEVRTGSTNAVFTIIQDPAVCNYTLSPDLRNHGHGTTNGTVRVVTSGGCAWTVDNTNAWIDIISASGLGSNEVVYSVQANTNLAPRTGYITFFGQDGIPPTSLVLTVNQQAATCTFSISRPFRLHGFGGSTDETFVTTLATCSWLVVNTNSWITITSAMPPGGKSGSGTLEYSVTNNPFPVARTGAVMIADQILTVAQRSSTDGPPFAFQTVECDPNGDVRMRLGGAPAGVWRIESTSNFVTWSQVALVTNTIGVVEYTHPHPAGSPGLFYRAILQP